MAESGSTIGAEPQSLKWSKGIFASEAGTSNNRIGLRSLGFICSGSLSYSPDANHGAFFESLVLDSHLFV